MKPAARKARKASAISSAEPRTGVPSTSAAPVNDVGSTTMPADRPIVAGIAADLDAGSLERREPRPELREVAPFLDVPAPDVGMARGQPEHLRTLGADHDRDPPGARPDRSMLQVARRVEGALEVRATAPQERDDDLDRLLESAVDVVLGQPEGVRLATGVP